jgi:hypothetical protein
VVVQNVGVKEDGVLHVQVKISSLRIYRVGGIGPSAEDGRFLDCKVPGVDLYELTRIRYYVLEGE